MRSEALITNNLGMKNLALDHFIKPFKQDTNIDVWAILNNKFPVLEGNAMGILNASFTDNEIKQAIMYMSPFNAPYLDGLHDAIRVNRTWWESR